MKISKTIIKGCYIIESIKFEDKRGINKFINFYESKVLINFRIDQIYQSINVKNMFKGFHYQKRYPQVKLISVIDGEIVDFIIDLRRNSNSYKKILSVNLKGNDSKYIYIPKGCAHGFYTKKKSKILYLIQGKFYSKYQTGINIHDDIFKKINKFINKETSISEKDIKLPVLEEKK